MDTTAARTWKERCIDTGRGWYELPIVSRDLLNDEEREVPVRLFLTPTLLEELEWNLYPQIEHATRLHGVRLVCITPDAHSGYGVPVGCVIVSDVASGSIALGPVGYDIGCGMVSLRSSVAAESVTGETVRRFNAAVIRRVPLGAGASFDGPLARLDDRQFETLVRGGAREYIRRRGSRFDRSHAERDVIPVDDGWELPRGRHDRGRSQWQTLGSGNHFIELQRSRQAGTLFVQIHTGSRGFGHGLAEHYAEVARQEQPGRFTRLDDAWFAPGTPGARAFLNAVAAGGNFAIINRLAIAEAVIEAFHEAFGGDLEMVYEVSHNLVQREVHPGYGEVWVHRKGATRAFPAGHPGLEGTAWAGSGHPVLIPGSSGDWSYILRPTQGASVSAYSVNHGAGRRLSRTKAKLAVSQEEVDRRYRDAGILVNTDGRAPRDEAPHAYKSSAEVIAAVTGAGLATIEHQLWPLAVVKGG